MPSDTEQSAVTMHFTRRDNIRYLFRTYYVILELFSTD